MFKIPDMVRLLAHLGRHTQLQPRHRFCQARFRTSAGGPGGGITDIWEYRLYLRKRTPPCIIRNILEAPHHASQMPLKPCLKPPAGGPGGGGAGVGRQRGRRGDKGQQEEEEAGGQAEDRRAEAGLPQAGGGGGVGRHGAGPQAPGVPQGDLPPPPSLLFLSVTDPLPPLYKCEELTSGFCIPSAGDERFGTLLWRIPS